MSAILSPNTKMNETKVVGGEAALDGSNPTPIETGLHVVTSVALTLGASAWSPRSGE